MWIGKLAWALLTDTLKETKAALAIRDTRVQELQIELASSETACRQIATQLRDAQALHAVEVEQLKGQISLTQNNFEWMRHQFNAMSNDRAILAQQKGLVLPAPQFERAGDAGTASQPSAGAPLTPGARVDDEAPPFAAPASTEDPDEWMKTVGEQVGNFEDVGDAAAAVLGVAHDDDGTLKIVTPTPRTHD